MTPGQIIRKARNHKELHSLGNAAIAAMVVFGGWLTIESIHNAPEAEARLAYTDAIDREEEDRAICSKFGVEPESEAFSACSRELVHVRRREAERIYRRMSFF